MKIAVAWFTVAVIVALNSAVQAQDMTIETAPPVIVKTVPEAGAKDVDPSVKEIKVTFSKDMADKSWSWSTAWENSTPETPQGASPKYSNDKRTCVLPVKLEPGKVYGFWINSEKFHGFQDADHRPAVPYLLVFRTK
jgi:hypothetical protein